LVASANLLGALDKRRLSAIELNVKVRNEALNVNMAKLDALSPLAVLTRGYSITQAEDGAILHDAASVKPGDKLKIRLERGKLNAEVFSVE
jgi:exodeoxyribonuclease VII large subunit